MASGDDYAGRFSLFSDQVFDRRCDVCEDDNTVSEAICYCTVCYKFYCTPCQDFHNKFHRDHRDKLLDKEAMVDTQPKQPARVALTTTCEEHGDRLVEMYCYDHDVVCCTVCLAINHKKCTKSEYVPKIADGFSKNPDVTKTRYSLQNVRKDLVAISSSRKHDQTRIKTEKGRVLVQVEESRRRINAVFDKLEEAVIRGSESRYNSFSDKIQTDMNECENVISKIEKAIDELDDTDNQHDAQVFVNVKRGMENMEVWRKMVYQIQGNIGKETIEFSIDGQIQDYLDRLEKLGEFVDAMREPRKVATRKDATHGVEQKHMDKLKGVIKPRTVVRKEDTMVKMKMMMRLKNDSNKCNIVGSCCLPDDVTMLSDNWNSKLKRLNSSYQIMDSCSIPNPRGVYYIQRSHKAAVCVYGAIKIVSLGKQMKVVRTIKMDNIACHSLAYCNELLYVSEWDGDKLYVYDYANGKLSLTVDTDTNGQKIFSRTRHIAANADSTRIWVADYDNGLIQLDKHCNLIQVVKIDEMGGVRGVCVDNEDNVYCCGVNPRNVLQLTSNGGKVSTLLREDELTGDPTSVCYDNIQSRLLVTTCTAAMKVVHFK